MPRKEQPGEEPKKPRRRRSRQENQPTTPEVKNTPPIPDTLVPTEILHVMDNIHAFVERHFGPDAKDSLVKDEMHKWRDSHGESTQLGLIFPEFSKERLEKLTDVDTQITKLKADFAKKRKPKGSTARRIGEDGIEQRYQTTRDDARQWQLVYEESYDNPRVYFVLRKRPIHSIADMLNLANSNQEAFLSSQDERMRTYPSILENMEESIRIIFVKKTSPMNDDMKDGYTNVEVYKDGQVFTATFFPDGQMYVPPIPPELKDKQ